jgi:uncharacterized protein YacL
MKRIVTWGTTVLSVAFVMLVTFVAPVVAQPLDATKDPFKQTCAKNNASDSAVCKNPTYEDPVSVTIANVIQVIIMVLAFAAVVTIMVSGFRYITSSGNPETTNSAKNAILFAIIGLVVALFAQAIVTFVLRKL